MGRHFSSEIYKIWRQWMPSWLRISRRRKMIVTHALTKRNLVDSIMARRMLGRTMTMVSSHNTGKWNWTPLLRQIRVETLPDRKRDLSLVQHTHLPWRVKMKRPCMSSLVFEDAPWKPVVLESSFKVELKGWMGTACGCRQSEGLGEYSFIMCRKTRFSRVFQFRHSVLILNCGFVILTSRSFWFLFACRCEWVRSKGNKEALF